MRVGVHQRREFNVKRSDWQGYQAIRLQVTVNFDRLTVEILFGVSRVLHKMTQCDMEKVFPSLTASVKMNLLTVVAPPVGRREPQHNQTR